MYNGLKIGVVVLAYKVENQIKDTIENLPEFIDKIYVIEDGSPDRTATIVRSLNHSQVNLIQHETNKGPGGALSTGYHSALEDNMDIVVKLDGDGQMPPEQIISLIMPITKGEADYTKGDRLSRPELHDSMPRFRLFGNRLLTWLTRIASGYWHINDSQNGFTAISHKALQTINLSLYPYYGYLNDLLVQLNVHHFKTLDVPMRAKYGGERSSIQLTRYVPKLSWLLLTRFLWRLKVKYFRREGSRSRTTS